MALEALRPEERAGLAVAVVLHAALVAALLLQPRPENHFKMPDRMAVSLVVAMTFYLCVILLQSLDKVYALQPYVLLWIPVAACGVLAAYLIPKNL